jgi:hypothetical protein
MVYLRGKRYSIFPLATEGPQCGVGIAEAPREWSSTPLTKSYGGAATPSAVRNMDASYEDLP